MPKSHQPASFALLARKISTLTIEASLRFLCEEFEDAVSFSTSFSKEDQAISHIIFSGNLRISVFTLDTGRLFPETYSVWRSTNERYRTAIRAYCPDAAQLEPYISVKGPNAFYDSVENRKECCFIRKVEPLKRALKNQQIWITGLRAEHSQSREGLQQLEWDESNGLVKYHPLINYTTGQVDDFIKENNIPYNPLNDKAFVSIGCAPCTRAISPGEDFRAGRWWWEQSNGKECGLHVHQAETPLLTINSKESNPL